MKSKSCQTLCDSDIDVVIAVFLPASTHYWFFLVDALIAIRMYLPRAFVAFVLGYPHAERERILADLALGNNPPQHERRLDFADGVGSLEHTFQRQADHLLVPAPGLDVAAEVPSTVLRFTSHPISHDPLATTFASRSGVVFVGSSSINNNMGLEWFVGSVWPLILEEVPSATMTVVGSVRCRGCGNAPQVEFKGVVPDPELEDLLRQKRVFVSPALARLRLLVKHILAFENGLPVVTTLNGTADLPFENELTGFAVTTTSGAVEFAKATAELLSDVDRWQAAARAAVRLAATSFSPSLFVEDTRAFLQHVRSPAERYDAPDGCALAAFRSKRTTRAS
eukprot:NODE_1053_length_1738_cov_24.020130_g930_i0.p1 GENE.NODE_1053_length_1738_cov_24.020130_g930_i0~~NODE_1053_length_1738_cov_24.020130_g930_i0.p1  ORF type:complete len:338 (+),score=53.23 NODE_1053_length_1738_cov_24.020130_g930_i0:699-1712(+)